MCIQYRHAEQVDASEPTALCSNDVKFFPSEQSFNVVL